MLIRYNTPLYRKLYKSYVERYDNCDKVVNIEDRVRGICAHIRNADLGVSVWSCEGHGEPFNAYTGYIMFAPRNREAASIMMDVFQQVSAKLIQLYGWDSGIEIEHGLVMTTDTEGREHQYPCVTIRNTSMTEEHANVWWKAVDTVTKALLKSRIEWQAFILANKKPKVS